jgi:hypothetical protein
MMGQEGKPMSDEQNESRINIEDLPQAEQELTAEEAQEVNAGAGTTVNSAGALQNFAGTNTWRE